MSLIDRILRRGPVIDPESASWLLDCYQWALEWFDAELFAGQTELVIPSNRHFPGRAGSVGGMAELIFNRVKHYACLSHWPTTLHDASHCTVDPAPQVVIEPPIRRAGGADPDMGKHEGPLLPIYYNPDQVSNPEGMIATFAHTLAHYLGQMAGEPPPGGRDFWPQSTEVLATFLGFGLMFANSAYTFRGGCGSCYNPNAVRQAYLTEVEATYALAIFCFLKGIDPPSVTPHLKRHLRSPLRRALAELAGQPLALLLRERIEKLADGSPGNLSD